MSADIDQMISIGVNTPTSEVDIQMCPTDLCLVVAAANDRSGDFLSLQKIFRSSDCGLHWFSSFVSPFPGDRAHRHPSVGFQSDRRVWAVNMASTDAGLDVLRCYFSDNNGASWIPDQTFAADQHTTQSPIRSPRMSIDNYSGSSSYPLRDTIYAIWGSSDPVSGNNLVFLKSRNPDIGAWREAILLDSQSLGPVDGCDIKAETGGRVAAFWHDTGSGKLIASVSSSNDLQNGPVFGPTSTIANATASPGISIPSCANAAISISSLWWASSLYVVWADLTDDFTKTRVWFSKATAFGNIGMWSNKKMIAEDDSLHDQFHPRIFFDQYTYTLVVVYYDTVGDSTRLRTRVWMQTSNDYGEHWNSPVQVAREQTDETAGGANQLQYGDYLGLTGAPPGFLFAAWTDRRSGLAEQIWARRLRFPPIPDPCGSDPILIGATITFNTIHDDKDKDTDLDIKVDTPYSWITAASAEVRDVYYDDDPPSSHTVTLKGSGHLVTKSMLRNVFLKITPHDFFGNPGNDTWKFKFNLDFTFLHGESMHLENQSEIELNQGSNTELIALNSLTQI